MTRPTHQRIRLVEVDKIWSRTEPIDMKAANGPKQAADALRELLPPDREGLAVLMLNCDYRVTAMTVVSVGTIDTVLVHPREIYKPALLANAHAIVIGHNHPEGDLRASDEDIATTKQIQAAGELLGITCLDHILIGNRKNKEFVSVVAVMLADEARKLGAALSEGSGDAVAERLIATGKELDRKVSAAKLPALNLEALAKRIITIKKGLDNAKAEEQERAGGA